MKKTFIIIGVCGMAALTGCQGQTDNARGDIYPKSGNTINVNDERADIYNQNTGHSSEDFGYVRHQRSPIQGDQVGTDHYASIDREKVADIIGKYCTEVPDVDDVSTLVTDKEVIIVYDTDSENPESTAKQVEKMAESVVPSWYNIYTTDDTHLRKFVESYATTDSDSLNVHDGIDQLIKEIQSSAPNRSGQPQEPTTNENNL
ncbi:YhcN/YlaJ family sporulation lipoprotein [Cytobacillus purgationiresistens]|uniref:Sporulation protein n=1 Tax=Cytobacillus purgationiresistens TaxID=863449 RepID=A0ABU0AP45_9BACI|nr:YhcN/YlaJ family sporulation lipoprotein [Cytobacillus purgationiresistens]MDQ0273056.1 hypothetical protein [Cytobacillus purgationiresistens]